MTMTMTNMTDELTELRDCSMASWDSVVTSNRIMRRAEKARLCRDTAEVALEAWDTAIRMVTHGRNMEAIDQLAKSRSLADEWGNCSYEDEAIIILRSAPNEVAS